MRKVNCPVGFPVSEKSQVPWSPRNQNVTTFADRWCVRPEWTGPCAFDGTHCSAEAGCSQAVLFQMAFWVHRAGPKDLGGRLINRLWRTCSREKQMTGMKELLIMLLGVIMECGYNFVSLIRLLVLDFLQL